MKKYMLMLILIMVGLSSLKTFAQSKIDKYCRVRLWKDGFNINNARVKIYFGDTTSLFKFKDTSYYTKLQSVNKLKNDVDVLNYMSKLGWTSVTIQYLTYGTSIINEFIIFKKSFDQAELIEDTN